MRPEYKNSNIKSSDLSSILGSHGGSEGKESSSSTGDLGSIPGSGISPGEWNGNPLQYSCLNSMDLAGYNPWGHKKSDMTERLTLSQNPKSTNLSNILSYAHPVVFQMSFCLFIIDTFYIRQLELTILGIWVFPLKNNSIDLLHWRTNTFLNLTIVNNHYAY